MTVCLLGIFVNRHIFQLSVTARSIRNSKEISKKSSNHKVFIKIALSWYTLLTHSLLMSISITKCVSMKMLKKIIFVLQVHKSQHQYYQPTEAVYLWARSKTIYQVKLWLIFRTSKFLIILCYKTILHAIVAINIYFLLYIYEFLF